MNKKNRKGFTIVELVIVIAVIGILATVLVPTFGDVISGAKDKAAMQEAKNLYTQYVANAADDAGSIVSEVYYKKDGVTVKVTNGSAVKFTETLPEHYFEIKTGAVVDCNKGASCATCHPSQGQ